MAIEGRPVCRRESCDGNLHHEFLTAMTRSTAQTLRLTALALIVAPLLFGAPFIIDYVVRQTQGVTGMVLTLVVLAVSIGIGVVLLRKRTAGLADKSEQLRCNKCGSVFPVTS